MCPQKWKASAFCARSASSTKPPLVTASSARPVRARKPRVGVVVLVEGRELDTGVVSEQPERRLERGAERTGGRREDRHLQRGVAFETLDQADAAAELRALVLERECGLRRDRQPQLAELTSEREQRDGQRGHAHERDPEPDAEP